MSKQPQSSKLVSKAYNFAYKIGYSPWDSGPPLPELIDIVEGENRLTPGRAVDLGCGAGSKSVYLAQHGWRVTGVDIAPEALKRARRKARDSGLDIEFVECDLVDIPSGALKGPFDFLLDFGCAHSLRDEAKARYAEGIAGIAAPGATLYMFAFTKGPLSVRQEEVDTAFAEHWDLVSATPGVIRRDDKWDAGPTWYRMTRRA